MSTLAVVSQSGESLSFFDQSGTRTGQLTDLHSEPHELCYDDQANLLYISHAYRHGWYAEHGDFASEISVVDCTQRKEVETIDVRPAGGTHHLALDRKRGILYASVEDGLSDNLNAGGIIGIDLKTHKVIKKIESGYKSHWFVMTPDGSKAFTCNKDADFISVIDLISEELISKIELPGGTEQPSISTDGKLAYFPTPAVTNVMSGQFTSFSIKVIDTASAQIVHDIPVDKATVSVHVDRQNRLLLGQFGVRGAAAAAAPEGAAPAMQGGGLSVLAPATEDYRHLGTVETGEVPLTLLASPDGKTAYVANIFRGTVSVVDLDTMSIRQTLDVDTMWRTDKKFHQGAHGLALIP